jgi:cysteinyl-tRNA synthetase
MLILTSNYRHPLKYSEKILEQTEKTLERLRSALKPELPGANGMDEDSSALLANEIEVATNGFELAMDDDFNGAGALACLFDLVRVINQSRDQGATDEELKPAQDLIVKLTGVLGLELAQGGAKDAAVDPFIELLLKVRKDARDNKNWAMSDLIRDELLALGVVIEDHKEGSTWHWA